MHWLSNSGTQSWVMSCCLIRKCLKKKKKKVKKSILYFDFEGEFYLVKFDQYTPPNSTAGCWCHRRRVHPNQKQHVETWTVLSEINLLRFLKDDFNTWECHKTALLFGAQSVNRHLRVLPGSLIVFPVLWSPHYIHFSTFSGLQTHRSLVIFLTPQEHLNTLYPFVKVFPFYILFEITVVGYMYSNLNLSAFWSTLIAKHWLI